jgi:3D (Asp-Asp-Asp) domain-containing protein
MKNKRYLWISLILIILIIQVKIGGNILNNYEQRIKSMQHTVNTLETKANVLEVEVKNNKESINIHTQQVSRGDIRTLKMEATAYNATVEQCGNDKGITASGTKVKKYRTIATDPSVIPTGSIVKILSDSEYVNGIYVAEDTGNFKGNRVDIFMESKNCAIEFGRRNVSVQILKEGWSD